MEAPQRIEPKGLADYLNVMSKAVFQTGISWRVVEAKWSGIRACFHDFDPGAVASLTPDDVATLTSDSRVIRNRRKIEAIIQNAQQLLDLEEQPRGFRGYLRSHASFEALVADLRKRFRFLGHTGAYYFLYVVGEDVPPHEEWMAAHQSRRR